MIEYEVYLSDPSGQRIATLNQFIDLEYALTVNNIGALSITLPASFNTALLRRDCRIEVWRAVAGNQPRLEGDQQWFVRRWGRRIEANSAESVRIGAVSALHLVQRRIIAYNAGTSFTNKTGAADAVMTTFVTENLGSAVNDAARDGDDEGANLEPNLTVIAAPGVCPSISKIATRRNLLTVCQEIADASAQLGTYLAFDVIWDGAGLTFQTFPQWRGTDRRITSQVPALFGPDFGNVSAAEVIYDYGDEVTAAIAGGAGQEDQRIIQTEIDLYRLRASPFNRIERFFGDGNVDTATALLNVARAMLRDNRPRVRFAGAVQDTPGMRYGRDWMWGDYVTVQWGALQFDCRIDAVRVRVANQRETIDATLRGEALDE